MASAMSRYSARVRLASCTIWRQVSGPTPLYPDSPIWMITLEPVDGGTRIVQRYEVVKLNPIWDRLFYLTTPQHRDRIAALTDDLRRLGEVARTGVPAVS